MSEELTKIAIPLSQNRIAYLYWPMYGVTKKDIRSMKLLIEMFELAIDEPNAELCDATAADQKTESQVPKEDLI